MAKYRINVGLDYGDKRAESGDVVDDLPSKSLKWLVDQGMVELADKSTVDPALAEEDEEGK